MTANCKNCGKFINKEEIEFCSIVCKEKYEEFLINDKWENKLAGIDVREKRKAKNNKEVFSGRLKL